MKLLNKFLPFFLIFLVALFLFWQFFLKGLIPLPADTIVGMYHPWRDLYSKNYPNGIPVNNPLITDPVRQQFVWKKLVIDSYKNGKLPTENLYSFSGYPLLANFQSGAFYPLNILFFLFSFNIAWGMYIYFQFLFGGIFMFLFLRNLFCHHDSISSCHSRESGNLNLCNPVALLGSIVWILSGFWIAWSEWGNILHTALWLPLVLLSINHLVVNGLKPFTTIKYRIFWSFVFLFSLLSSFFAGHLQIFFYLFVFSLFYFIYKILNTKYKIQLFLLFSVLCSLFSVLSSVQWYPTLQFILASGRSTDVVNILTREDWFIPSKHFVQLFIPDYFGNPAKGNYFGVWNYGEFLSYIGIIPIFLAIYGIFRSVVSKKNIFWLLCLSIVIIFATKNSISIIPYQLRVPFFSTAQPSRLIFLLDFLLVIFFCKSLLLLFPSSLSSSRMRGSSILFLIFLGLLVVLGILNFEHSNIILRNSIQPIAVFIIFSLMITLINRITPARHASQPRLPCLATGGQVAGVAGRLISKHSKLFFPILFLLIFFDQSRVFWRYNTFAEEKYIFPETKIIKFLKNDLKTGFFRISSLDARIMPPNFSAFYKISSIDGYDPLYYENYARIISKDESTNFNRIIQLSDANSKIYDELKVKYVLTFNNLSEQEYKLVLIEGKTKLYKYLNFK